MLLQEFLEKNPKTHLIFDFDNTLFRLHLPWAEWDKRIRHQLKSLDSKTYEQYERGRAGEADFVLGLSELQNHYVKNFGKKALNLFLANNEQFETEDQTGVSINQELVDFISNNQYTYHLWSSNTKAAITPILEQYHLTDTFTTTVTRNDVDLLKPDPEGFNQHIYDNNTDKSEYLMIGDSQSDKGAASASGIDFYLVSF